MTGGGASGTADRIRGTDKQPDVGPSSRPSTCLRDGRRVCTVPPSESSSDKHRTKLPGVPSVQPVFRLRVHSLKLRIVYLLT